MIQQQSTTMGPRYGRGRASGPPPPRPMETAPLSILDAPRLPQRAASFLAGGVGGKAKQQARGRQSPHLFSQGGDRHQTNHKPNEVYTCTEFFSGPQRDARCGNASPPGAALSRSDRGSKSQRASTEKGAGERYLPSCSDSSTKETHHIVKRPDQAGIRVPARGPSHLHPTWGTDLNPATTRSYVEGVAPRIGLPTMATGPPHNTRYNVHLRAPTRTLEHPPPPWGNNPSPLFNLQRPPCHPTPTTT